MDEILKNSKESFGIKEFLEISEEYVNKNFKNVDIEKFFDNTLNGKFDFNLLEINIFDPFKSEILEVLKILVIVLIVIIIHSIFKIIVQNLNNSSNVKIISFIQYLIIVSITLELFGVIISELKSVLDDLLVFMNMFVPFLSILIVSTGNVVTSSVIEGTLFFSIIFISNFIKKFLIPLYLIVITISVVSNFTDKFKLEKLSKFFRSSIIWILGIILTIFISILTMETEITSSVDSFTSKTTKAAISNFIPVVGKIMGDSVDAVLGSFNVLKNSVGVMGIIVVLSLTLFPIIKVFVMYVLFNLTSAFAEIVAEEKIVSLISNLSDCLRTFLGMLISISIMFIVEVVIVIKITNGIVM